MPNEVNPLGFVGKFQPTAPNNEALQKLLAKGAITNANNQSLERRTDANNINSFRTQGLTQNLPITREEASGDLGAGNINSLQRSRGLGDALTGAKGLNEARSAGIGRVSPKTPFKLPEAADELLISGLQLKGELANKHKAGAELNKKNEIENFPFVTGTDGVRRFSKVKSSQGAKRTGEVKGSTEALQRAREVLAAAQTQFPGLNPQVEERGGKLVIRVGGKVYEAN